MPDIRSFVSKYWRYIVVIIIIIIIIISIISIIIIHFSYYLVIVVPGILVIDFIVSSTRDTFCP